MIVIVIRTACWWDVLNDSLTGQFLSNWLLSVQSKNDELSVIQNDLIWASFHPVQIMTFNQCKYTHKTHLNYLCLRSLFIWKILFATIIVIICTFYLNETKTKTHKMKRHNDLHTHKQTKSAPIKSHKAITWFTTFFANTSKHNTTTPCTTQSSWISCWLELDWFLNHLPLWSLLQTGLVMISMVN